MSQSMKAMIESYVRNAAAAIFGAVLIVMKLKNYGSPLELTANDLELVANALWTGALPTLYRYLNKKDPAFGRYVQTTIQDIEKKNIKAIMKPAKKIFKK